MTVSSNYSRVSKLRLCAVAKVSYLLAVERVGSREAGVPYKSHLSWSYLILKIGLGFVPKRAREELAMASTFNNST